MLHCHNTVLKQFFYDFNSFLSLDQRTNGFIDANTNFKLVLIEEYHDGYEKIWWKREY